uniref:hypothetical protein orf376 n=1 Tax=Rhodomelopsis africana TaxID=1917047 RepID=UPI0022FDA3E0|nr:hypothetical protein orf376 [Rhodomelopsis africana]WAX02689.1 hypothetical protein orf376 [Rhodomelopsis africana]
MFSCVIDKITFWEKLPWQKIKLRILMITKQIYIAMKKYDLIHVYQLQKYMINCNETKVMLINKIFCDLILYYSNCNKIKLLIKKINKIDIFYSLILTKSQSNQFSYIVIEYIKQDLIYISTEPTWIAKISKKSTKFINNTQLKHNLNLYKKINNNYFLTAIVMKKLSSYNYINKSISKWLYKNICLNLSKIYNLKYKEYIVENRFNILKLISRTSKCLYFLINKIIINDIYWYIFNHVRKSNSICKIINDKIIVLLHTNSIVNKSLKTFNAIFKQLLYRKTHRSSNVINVFNNDISLLNKFKFLYTYYYYNIDRFISINLIEGCNQLVNCFTYMLRKKQISQNSSKYQYIYKLNFINKLLNKLIYFCNIEYFYQYV